MGAAKARCGACHMPLVTLSEHRRDTSGGNLGRRVVEGWDDLMRHVPSGMALGRAVGRVELNQGADPVTWLASAGQVPRAELEQVRLLRVHLASNRTPPPEHQLSRALDTIEKVAAALRHTRLGD